MLNELVKQFTPQGEYRGLVGLAGVPEGCKISAVGVPSDGDYVFYIEVCGSEIMLAHPALAGTRLYIRDSRALYCLELGP